MACVNRIERSDMAASWFGVWIPEAGRGWALLTLPSGQLRLVDNRSYVALGGSHPQSRRFFVLPNAGWVRRAGRRPIVRGTVKNPNDHPHGGRTRAIRYPRTPWGRTAKYPRPPRALPRLKKLLGKSGLFDRSQKT